MFRPYLGNETGCLRESSIRSSAVTLPVTFVIPSPYSIHILETKLAKYMARTALERPNLPLSNETLLAQNPPFAPPQQPS
ncbi:hypothetical protein D9757_007825 [Collybiopsis confluens]|uniref:Uncharacterized protein n=1 Tax=Collybiopsis confluens TaxID=2823264 RepID=A0A8H5H0F4_9AGAR|nr:hypothetical protein D9757_011849 [Collybiopsis confluens]KAF5387449.1 hypothetical protein D9757_007825 [Collybiopsis confluens]